MPPASNQAVILERLESLKCDVKDIGYDVKEGTTALTNFQLEYEKRQGTLVEQINANTTQITRLDKEQTELKKELESLKTTVLSLSLSVNKMYSVFKWILGILTTLIISFMLSIIGFGYALLTHQIAIITITGTPIP